VKIFDFGLSREIDESSPEPWQYEATPRFMTGGTGTPRYMAPEVAQNHHFYSFPADVYSFTILLWQIVTTQTPFARISSRAEFAAKVFKKNKRPCLKGIESEPLRNLLETGWAADPDQRPSFSNVHQMLSSIILLPPVASDDRKVR
jgi:serine/threonine protein kinase